MLRNKYVMFAPLGLLSLTVLSGAFLMSSFVSADDSQVDNVSVNIPVSCSLSGTGMNSHNASVVNGTYQADIGTTTMKAFCNDTNGFAIYVIGYTDNEYGKTVLTNSTLGSSADIATGTATSGSTSNWAMKLATSSGATYPLTLDNSFNAYHTVPSTYTKVAHRDNATDIGTNATGSSLTTTYAAFMAQTQPAGTYTGQVKYTLVHPATEEPLQPQPATAGCINYFANASTAIGEMGCQSASNNASVDLWASNFSRSGYGFAGWNDEFDYSGNYYGPNQTITAPSDVQTNGLSLYAVWIKSAGNLQDWTSSDCNSLAQGATTALTDERDNNTYAVAKLADGKCWMIENLRLENTGTDNTNGSLAQGYNSSFIGLAAPESANFDNVTTANSLYSTDGTTTATISGSYRDYRFPRYNNNNTNSRQSSSGYSASGNTYSMGNYYTWHAAIADTAHYSSGNHNTTSICPAGWHLPTGAATTGEFALLDIALGGTGSSSNSDTDPTGAVMSSRYRSYPNNFLYSGYFGLSSAGSRGSYGYYWSSTAHSSSTSYTLYLGSSSVYPASSSTNKYMGQSIRCTLGS